jgi:uncharacterized Fe-S cluster protein YjdI
MEETVKHYKKDRLTVVWQPALCAHSTLCWKGLNSVFDPQKKPWINVDGAEAEQILAQVRACPSGALSFLLEEEVA